MSFLSRWLVGFGRLKNGHYVATRAGTDAVDYAHSNRGYWTDGEESQRAPSERTLSEYTTANERNTSPPHLQSQKYRAERSLNAGPKNLGPLYGPPTRVPPRAPSALSYEHGGDTGSDIYVTSAAYRAPSEYRYVRVCAFLVGVFCDVLILYVCVAVIHIDQMRTVHEAYTQWLAQQKRDAVIGHGEPVHASKQCQPQTHFART